MHDPDELVADDGALDDSGFAPVERVEITPADAAQSHLKKVFSFGQPLPQQRSDYVGDPNTLHTDLYCYALFE